jgi:sodium/bile acid cotransporter 7
MLHPFLYRHISRYLVPLATFDKVIILLIVYESFSHSFLDGLFSGIGWTVLAALFGIVVLLFFFVLTITGLLARRLHFSEVDRITMQFAGTKKSLVHGSVFANVLFSGISGTGVLLLPIMVYHSFQLFYISILARNMQRQEASTRKN